MKKILVVLGIIALAASISHAAMRAGVDVGNITLLGINAATPYVGFQLNPDQTIDVGLTYTSMNDGNTTNLGLFGRFESNFMKADKVDVYWYGLLGLASSKAGGVTTTTINIAGGMGAEYMIAKNFAIYGNVALLTLQSMSNGGSQTNFGLVAGDLFAYSGLRIYLD